MLPGAGPGESFYHAVLVFAGGSAVLCSVRFEEGYGVAASDRYSLYVVLAHVAMLGMVRHRVVALYDNHRPVAAGACLIAIALIFAEHAVSGTAYRQRALAIGGVAQAIRSPDFPLAIMEEISPLHPDGGKALGRSAEGTRALSVPERLIDMCAYRPAWRAGGGSAAISDTSFCVIASAKLEKLSTWSRKLPGPPITFWRKYSGPERLIDMCAYRPAWRAGGGSAAISDTSFCVIASAKLEKPSTWSRKLPGPPITFWRKYSGSPSGGRT